MFLEVAGISSAGKRADVVQAEFQRAGYFLTYVLECAFETEARGDSKRLSLLERRLPVVATRLRRSLRPKRVVLISQALESVTGKIATMEMGCPIVLDEGKPFALDGLNAGEAAKRMREVIANRMD